MRIITTEEIFFGKDTCVYSDGRAMTIENLIAKRANCSLLYSSHVLNGRWPAAETTIASNPYLASSYAINVLHESFGLGEPNIKNNKICRFKYQGYFKIKL